MNFNNFTIKSQEAVQQAVTLATMNGQQAIENGHILKSILQVDESVTPFILKKLGINEQVFSKTLDSIVNSYPKVSGGQPYLSNNANQTIAKANTYLQEFKDFWRNKSIGWTSIPEDTYFANQIRLIDRVDID